MKWHSFHVFFFFKLVLLRRFSDGQTVSWVGNTIFDDMLSDNNNAWATGLPRLKLKFSSNKFAYSRFGTFNFDYKLSDNSTIKTCQFLVESTSCSINCGDSAFSCSGQPSSGLSATLDITNLLENMDGSYAILSLGLPPLTTDDEWNADPLYIGVQNCTEKTGGISQSSNFSQPSISCDYLCSTSLVCANGYSVSSGKNDLNATCQANNTWEENGTPCARYTAGYIGGIVISVIGGLAIVGNFVIVGLAWNTAFADGKNTILLALGITSTVFWALGIGLLFGLEKGDYAMNGGQIAGCVIGSIASVGAIASCVKSGMEMKESKS